MLITRSLSRANIRRLTVAAAAAPLLATGAAGAQTTPAGTPAPPAESPTRKPTVVLEHGPFEDASVWRAEVRLLRAQGFPVVAPADPLRGLAVDAAALRSVLTTLHGEVILVGHSYGGAVITNAALGDPHVTALVYLAAYVPDEGEDLAVVLAPRGPRGALLAPGVLRPHRYPSIAHVSPANVDLYIDPLRFRAVVSSDISPQRAAVLAAQQRPLAATALLEKSGVPAWRCIPSWALVTLDDELIPPQAQMRSAQHAGSHITTVASAHDVPISHPAEVLSVIQEAYAGTRSTPR